MPSNSFPGTTISGISPFNITDVASGNYLSFGLSNPGIFSINYNGAATPQISFYSDGTLTIAAASLLISGGGISAGNYQDDNQNQLLAARQPDVADATGGAIIDVQARAQLNLLLASLRTHGLIGS